MSEPKVLLVPDGLEGERVDAVVARVLGLSRGRSADLIAAGRVRLDGALVAKSDRALGGALLEVDLDEEPTGPVVVARAVEDLTILHEDADLVVVDKPPGVAAHPSLGWDGPDVLGALAAAGVSITTSGAPERRGDRPAPRRRHLRADGRGQERARVLGPQARLQGADGREDVPRAGPGPPGPVHRDDRRPDRPPPGLGVADGGRRRAAARASRTTTRSTPSSGTTLLKVGLETGRTHQIRVHMAAIHHPCVGDPTYGSDPVLAARLGLVRQWLHAVRLRFVHPGTGEEVEFVSTYPPDLAHALEIVSAA